MKKVALLSIITLFVLSGCTKFEEGPFITLKTNKQRIAQTWTLEAKYDATTGQEITIGDEKMTISKDGNYTYSLGGVQVIEGTWVFKGDDEIEFTYTALGFQVVDTYRIIKLYTEEFWMIDDDHETHYKPY